MTNDLNRQDELVDIRLPRAEAETLRSIIKERQTYSLLAQKLKSNWIWIVAAGLLGVWGLWEKFSTAIGVIK